MEEQQAVALVRRYRELGSMIAELQGEQAQIKTQVEQSTQAGWKLTVDGKAASHREANRKFDLITAVGLLSAEDKKDCVVTQYDPKKIREKAKALGIEENCMIRAEDAAPIVSL